MAPCSSCSLGKLIARPSPLKVEKESLMFLEIIQGDIYYIVKHVRLDNTGEFTSQSFNDYCMSVGIVVEHPVAHVHTQNGLAESLIKRLQLIARPLIARPLIMRTKLPVSIWGHAILHAASLIRMRPSENHVYSPMQLAFGQEPNISHLRIFGYAIYVPIAPPQLTKMGPQRRLGIYVGYETISIIRYLEPLMGDVFTSHLLIAILIRQFSPRLGKKRKTMRKMSHGVNLHYTKRVTKSYIPTVNAPAQVEIPDVKSNDKVTQESKVRLKRGRPVGSEDKNPRKRKATENAIIHEDIVLEETQMLLL
ncbi:disease resistance CC-NBS-LRR class family protein [Tanacetum coccineum]